MNPINELDRLARKYGTDKRTNDEGQNIYHGYTLDYDRYLNEFRFDYKEVMELGVREGFSHFCWRDYFPNAIIWGIDNFSDPACTVKKEDIESNRIKIIVGDQSDKKLIDDNFRDIRFDMIIDDGSHRSWHQQKSLKYLWKYLKYGGFYFIEDLGVCALREFREFDDTNSSTLVFLANIMNGNDVSSYYFEENELNKFLQEIEFINIVGELAVIKKVSNNVEY
jgi:hypothetical protein